MLGGVEGLASDDEFPLFLECLSLSSPILPRSLCPDFWLVFWVLPRIIPAQPTNGTWGPEIGSDKGY